MTVSRVAVSTALFNLLISSGNYVTSGRRWKDPYQLSANDKPALFLCDNDEEDIRGKTATPALRSLKYEVWINIATGLDPNAVPIDALNALIDAIDPVSGGVLAPNNPQNKQTLGGLVYDCFIDGKIIKVPGDIDGIGIGIIPITVVFHQAF